MEKKLALLPLSLLLSVLALAQGLAKADPEGRRHPVDLESPHVEGELILKLKASDRSAAVMSGIAAALDAEDAGALKEFPALHKLELHGRVDMKEAIESLRTMPEVAYAEPNYLYSTRIEGVKPSDKYFKQQWNLHNTGQKIQVGGGSQRKVIKGKVGADMKALEAWAIDPKVKTAAADVIVAVIDTGAGLTHRDLKANLWKNPGENGPWQPPHGVAQPLDRKKKKPCVDRSCNGIDDDGNGFVDDYQGWNWAVKVKKGKPLVGNNRPLDDNMHGTHVSGIIGATHNKRGVSGVNAAVRIMPLKFLDKNGSGTLEGAIEAIGYAIRMKADVINASWGGPGDSEALGEAVEAAIDNGILFVVAAGNSAENNDQLVRTPTNYPGVLSVVATDMKDQLTDFSSYGRVKTHVAAPGFQILSTVRMLAPIPNPLPITIPIYYNTYSALSGTSMAAPHVAGLAAMLIGLDPASFRHNPEALKRRIMETSDILPSLVARTASGGRINAYNAVRGIVTPGHARPAEDVKWSPLVTFPAESAHPYPNGATYEHVIRHPGAKWIRVRFGKYSIEPGIDQIELRDGKGTLFDVLTGFGTGAVSHPIQGDEVRLSFKADSKVNAWGYEIAGYEFAE